MAARPAMGGGQPAELRGTPVGSVPNEVKGSDFLASDKTCNIWFRRCVRAASRLPTRSGLLKVAAAVTELGGQLSKPSG